VRVVLDTVALGLVQRFHELDMARFEGARGYCAGGVNFETHESEMIERGDEFGRVAAELALHTQFMVLCATQFPDACTGLSSGVEVSPHLVTPYPAIASYTPGSPLNFFETHLVAAWVLLGWRRTLGIKGPYDGE